MKTTPEAKILENNLRLFLKAQKVEREIFDELVNPATTAERCVELTQMGIRNQRILSACRVILRPWLLTEQDLDELLTDLQIKRP